MDRETKRDITIYNPEGKRKLYENSKDVKDIFPYLQPEWNFSDWEEFLWFFEVTRPTYIYIFDRLEKHEQFELKYDFLDCLQTVIDQQTATKYKKAIQAFKAGINNYAVSSEKDEEQINSKEGSDIHPKYDPNLWNRKAYDLFKYLFENYYVPEKNGKKPSKQKLAYIFLFIKDREHENDNTDYVIHATKDEYFIFLNENYNLFPTNRDKRENYGKHEIRMKEHQQLFENSIK